MNNEKQNKLNNEKQNKLKFIDLFCGIGGFHQALNKLNCECVFASDIDVKCRDVYKLNYNLTPEGDITKIDIKTIHNFDILCFWIRTLKKINSFNFLVLVETKIQSYNCLKINYCIKIHQYFLRCETTLNFKCKL